MSHKRSLLGGCLSALGNKFLGNKKGFSITEVLIALGVIAVIAVLILPVITTRAQNKSFALSYDTEVKQMLNSLEGLPVSENKEDISNTMMYVESDTGSYANNAGAYINKYMKVVKYCGDEPGDCFGGQYYEYKDNDRVEFDINDIKGACALLKNGVSICLKPQIKNASGAEEIQGWIDLNGPKGPNIYGRDLRTFAINLKQKAVFTEEEPTRVIVPDPPAPCEGEDCGEIEKDPCKVNPRGEECCKRDGFVASGTEDICCPWYRDASTGPNHLLCYPGSTPCDPAKDPNCKIDECTNHAITGPGDECCAIIESQGKHDPNCCAPNDVSDYCCSVHPETEGCCRKNIQSGKLQLTADSNCCTKYPTIYAEFSACKPACEQNNNSEQCCNTVSRRNEIREPDDACCMYEAVNGLDAQGENNAYNKYCCRLPKNNSDQCCKWKYDHINSSLDYYTKHDYNVNGGTFDGCCHGNIRGIKYTANKTDAKSIAVLNRCCTVNQAQSDKKEDELCCDYLVGQLGVAKLQHGQALRRCCQYDKHKNKPQCCSHQTDGMASQTYPASPVVNWAAQCCMPNSIYNNNVDPHIQCCFAVPNALGESNAFWNNKRWDGCCAHGENTYNGHKANTEGQWQKNCCKLTRAKYPSDATYNAACCNANATAKGANRDSWQYFSATKNECCETLDNQYNKSRDDNWQSHCCYGFKGGNWATNNPYYETEQKCCKISGNWTEGCCTKSGLNTNDEKWKKNCCSLPTQYSSNVEYRKYCCFDSNTSNSKANSTDKDYTRNSDNADNPNNKNAANVNNSNNKQYCCDPDMANTYTTENNGQTFKWSSSNTPNKSCCQYFQSKGWFDNDGKPLSKYYKAACCQAHHVYDENNFNCEEKWMCGSFATYGIPGGMENTCCMSDYTYQKKDVTTPNVWRPGCCDFPTKYTSIAIYRGSCCSGSTSDYTRSGKGDTNNNKQYCCFPDSTDPNTECCKLFRSMKTSDTAWKDWDVNTLSEDYMTYCCNKSTAAGSNSSNNYCPDSCAIRWNTAESKASINYDFSRCCTDRALATNKSPVNSSTAVNRTKAIWKNNCCAYSPVNPAGNNIAGYASYTDYRSGCCNASQDQTFKSGNGGSSQNNINCCIPNQTTVNTSTGAVSGIVPTKACCEAFKAYDSSKSGAWKSHDGETINDAYKTACCKLHGVCPDGPDACRIRSNTWNTSMYNLPTCCTDSTMQSQHYKDSDQVWRKACCDGGTTGKSTLNTLGDADYRNYCCSNAGSSDATLKSGTQDRRCCKNAGNTTRLRNQYCCSYEPSSRSDLTNIGYHCDCTTGANTWQVVNQNYTDCCVNADVMTNAASSITKNATTRADWQSKCCTRANVHTSPANNTVRDRHYSYCCNNGGAYANKSTWLNTTCCYNQNSGNNTSSNNGLDWKSSWDSACCNYNGPANVTCCDAAKAAGYSSAVGGRTFRDKCCQLSGQTGKAYCDCEEQYRLRFSDYFASSTACCADQKAKRGEANWNSVCCTSANPGGLTRAQFRDANCCSNSATGLAKIGGGYITHCCDGSTITRDNTDYCCKNYSSNQCACTDTAGGAANNNLFTRCCTGTSPTDANNKYCCITGNRDNQCTCNNANGKLQNGHYATRCCTGTSPTSENSNYCCVTGNRDSQCTCNNANGKLTNGHYATRCCTGTSPTSENSNYCCVTGNRDSQCTCANGNGKLTNGHYAARCCTNTSTPTTENSSYCCMQGYNGMCTCANGNGKLTNGNYAARCCTNTSTPTTENSSYCCMQGYNGMCTCANGNGKLTNGNYATRCCTGTSPTSENSNYCCVTGNRDSQCTCANGNGKLTNGHYAKRCCTNTSTPTTENSSYCCMQGYNGMCTCANANGKLTNGSYATRCCTGTSPTTENSNYCCVTGNRDSQCTCNNANGKLTNGHYATRCCTGTSPTTENNNYCCLTANRDSQCTCAAKWRESSCCSVANINTATGTNRQSCCKLLRNNKPSGWNNLFSGPSATCCQSLSGRDDGYSSYLGTYIEECKAPCYKSGTYSTGKYSSNKSTTNSAAYCCKNNYGLVSGGSSNSTWKSYCCGTYNGSSWNFPPSSYSGCCNYVYSNGVWWYNPSYYGGSCSFGGEKNKCADYKYTSAGFTCGSDNACKAWRFQGGSQPTLSSCCSSLYSWGYLSGSYKTTCCGDSTFRKSSTGQSVCCSSEPSSLSLAQSCCSDNSSRSYCSYDSGCSGNCCVKLSCGVSGTGCSLTFRVGSGYKGKYQLDSSYISDSKSTGEYNMVSNFTKGQHSGSVYSCDKITTPSPSSSGGYGGGGTGGGGSSSSHSCTVSAYSTGRAVYYTASSGCAGLTLRVYQKSSSGGYCLAGVQVKITGATGGTPIPGCTTPASDNYCDIWGPNDIPYKAFSSRCSGTVEW